MKIMVGQGSCGVAAGAGKVYDAILAGMRERQHRPASHSDASECVSLSL